MLTLTIILELVIMSFIRTTVKLFFVCFVELPVEEGTLSYSCYRDVFRIVDHVNERIEYTLVSLTYKDLSTYLN